MTEATSNKTIFNKTISNTPFKLYMFDLDGTLIDSVPDLATAVDTMLQSLSLPVVGEAQVRAWVGNGAAKLVERALLFGFSGNADIDSQINQQSRVQEQLASVKVEALSRFFACYQGCCTEKTVLYPGVAEALNGLQQQQVLMAIVTNKPREFVGPILQALGIEQYFALILGGDDLSDKKPHPAPLLHCMQTLGCTPQQTLMIGDSRNDVQAARNAGVLVAAVDYGYNHGASIDSEGPDIVVSTINDLIDMIPPSFRASH